MTGVSDATGIRVLHIGKFFPPFKGGMETFLGDLVQSQQDAGLSVCVLVHGEPAAEDPQWLVRVPVELQLVYAPISFGYRQALVKAIQDFGPDILHIHLPNPSAFWALFCESARAIPWVVHWHADVVVSKPTSALALAYRLYRPFEQSVLEKAERIFVTSPDYLAASEPLRYWQAKCSVIPLGLRFAPAPTEAAQADFHPWKSGTLRLLSVGRLTYYKGFQALIRAVAGLPGVELVIAGDGELKASLAEEIALLKAPNVTLAGSVDEPTKSRLLHQCDVFCLPSIERTEAFGLVLLEAMVASKPCIVSNLEGSGMTWLVRQSGAGLFHLPPGDVQAWRGCFAELANMPNEQRQAQFRQWGENGHRAVTAQFNIEQCASQVLVEYRLAQSVDTPSAGQHTQRSGHSDILVVIPARNEAATIATVVQSLKCAGWHHILVIDDQSTDDTNTLASANGATVLRPVLPVGAWGGMQTGMRYAMKHGFHAVITMDADGQHEVEEIPQLIAASACADVVIGAFPERASRLRRAAWRWFRQLSGVDLQDLTSGFRYYNLDAVSLLASPEATLLDYQDIGALLLIRRAGLSIQEVPVSMNMRLSGKSRIFNSWVSVARYMAVTTLLCLARWHPANKGTATARANA